MRAAVISALALLVIAVAPAAIANTLASPPSHCVINAGNGKRSGLEGIVVDGKCVAVSEVGASSSSGPRVDYRQVACLSDGTIEVKGHTVAGTCGRGVPECPRTVDTGAGANRFVSALAEQARPVGSTRWITLSFFCPRHTEPVPAPTASDVRDRAVRLLPSIPVRTTGPNTLVNIQTLFWAGTTADRDLGTVTVVGQPVRLRAQVAYVDWDFGDGHTDRTDGPGKPYDRERDRCDTVMCPEYFGHVYRRTGQMTVSVRITWDASYSLDGGATYNPVGAAPITGPVGTAQVLVRQARAQLVSD